MITAIFHCLATLVTQAPTIDLIDHSAAFSSASVHSITTDGDTAYICQGSTVTKMVYGQKLKIIDSLPSRSVSGWNDAKYVHLGMGMGMLAYVEFPFKDTAIWLIDWNNSSQALAPQAVSKWAAYLRLPLGEGFSWDCKLVGQNNGQYRAVFGGDKGLFQFFYAGARGQRILGLESAIGYNRSSIWSDLSLGATAFSSDRPLSLYSLAATSATGDRMDFWQTTAPHDSLSQFSISDRSQTIDIKNPASIWAKGSNLAAPSGTGWLFVSRLGQHGMFFDKPYPTSTLGIIRFELPRLVSNLGQQFDGHVVVARSDEGKTIPWGKPRFAALAGDSLLAIVDWDGKQAPIVLKTVDLRYQTTGLAFGDSVLWLANKGEIHAWRIHLGSTSSLLSKPSSAIAWSIGMSRGQLTVSGSVGTELSVHEATGRRLATIRIGASQSEELPRSGGMLLVKGPDGSKSVYSPR